MKIEFPWFCKTRPDSPLRILMEGYSEPRCHQNAFFDLKNQEIIWQTPFPWIYSLLLYQKVFYPAGICFLRPFLLTSNKIVQRFYESTKRGWFQWFVQQLETVSSAHLWPHKDVHTTAGFAMKPLRLAMDVIVCMNSQPAGIAQHAPSHHWNGKMGIVIWHPMLPLPKRAPSRKSIRSKRPKEATSNTANHVVANPVLHQSGVFLFVLGFKFYVLGLL